ncbi:MAG: hypothetical protein M9962_14130 [Oligoflexia bacterium]|nr:hypothetical protein [Oligoflexia bacterium]
MRILRLLIIAGLFFCFSGLNAALADPIDNPNGGIIPPGSDKDKPTRKPRRDRVRPAPKPIPDSDTNPKPLPNDDRLPPNPHDDGGVHNSDTDIDGKKGKVETPSERLARLKKQGTHARTKFDVMLDDAKGCEVAYAGLHDAYIASTLDPAYQAVNAYYRDFSKPNFLLNFGRQQRDNFRKWIQRKRGREYPVMALDDGTTLKANFWARMHVGDLGKQSDDLSRDFFETLPKDKQDELIKRYGDDVATNAYRQGIEELDEEVIKLVEQVTTYPKRYEAFVKDTLEMRLETAQLEQALLDLSKTKKPTHKVYITTPEKIEIPILKKYLSNDEIGILKLKGYLGDNPNAKMSELVDFLEQNNIIVPGLDDLMKKDGIKVAEVKKHLNDFFKGYDVSKSLTGQPVGNRESMLINLSKKKSEIKNRMGKFRLTFDFNNKSFPWLMVGRQESKDLRQLRGQVEAIQDTEIFDQIALKQAVNIKKMETYLAELNKIIDDKKFVGDVPENVAEIRGKMMSIFEDATENQLKSEYRLPNWAWNSLRWKQFWGEMKATFVRDMIRVSDEVEDGVRKLSDHTVVRAATELTPDELQALGYRGNASQNPGFIRKTIGLAKNHPYIAIALGTFAGPTGGYSLPYLYGTAYNFVMWEKVKKAECSKESSLDGLNQCFMDYLELKFPGEKTEAELTANDPYTDGKGNFRAKFKPHYEEFLKEWEQQMMIETARELRLEAIRQAGSKIAYNSPYNEEYMMKVSKAAKDEDFIELTVGGKNVLANTDPVKDPIFRKMFKSAFDGNVEIIQSIMADFVDQKDSFDASRHPQFVQLEKAHPSVATALSRIMDARRDYWRDKEDQLAEGTGADTELDSIE